MTDLGVRFIDGFFEVKLKLVISCTVEFKMFGTMTGGDVLASDEGL